MTCGEDYWRGLPPAQLPLLLLLLPPAMGMVLVAAELAAELAAAAATAATRPSRQSRCVPWTCDTAGVW